MGFSDKMTDITNFLFEPVYQSQPEWSQNLPASVMFWGYVPAYLFTRGIQLFSKYVIDRFAPGFDEKGFPWIERAFLIGIPLSSAVYACIDQQGAEYIVYNKPMDMLGVFMAYLGGASAAVPDLYKKGGIIIKPIKNLVKDYKQKILEKRIKEYFK